MNKGTQDKQKEQNIEIQQLEPLYFPIPFLK